MVEPPFQHDEAAVSDHEIVIAPNRSWLAIDWRELWEYRDLLFLLVRRDFVAKYKQTILGPLWFIIQPLLMTVVFTVIFGNIAKISTDELPGPLFYLANLVLWGYFAQNLGVASAIFTTNAYLFTKVYFPRLIVPGAAAVSSLFGSAIQLVTFLGFLFYYNLFTAAGALISIRWEVILLPLVVLQMIVMSLGVSLWMSSLTAKYRDFTHLMGFLTQIWMYCTPVVFPLSEVRESLRWLFWLNPMTAVIEWFRYAFLGNGVVTGSGYILSVVISLILFVTGVMVFNRTARKFVDTV